MFDKEFTGFVNVNDLQTIMKSLGRDPQEAKIECIYSLTVLMESYPAIEL